jgi:hypothetical protein
MTKRDQFSDEVLDDPEGSLRILELYLQTLSSFRTAVAVGMGDQLVRDRLHALGVLTPMGIARSSRVRQRRSFFDANPPLRLQARVDQLQALVAEINERLQQVDIPFHEFVRHQKPLWLERALALLRAYRKHNQLLAAINEVHITDSRAREMMRLLGIDTHARSGRYNTTVDACYGADRLDTIVAALQALIDAYRIPALRHRRG